MDEIIIKNLEERIKPQDILYFLGDLTFKEIKAREFFERFEKIEVHFIIGNHDSRGVIKIAKEFCASVSHLKAIKIEDQPITLCHYAMRVWNKSHFNAWQLYGHSHAKLLPVGKQYDVGVDNNDFYPISFNSLMKIMKESPDNFNYIPPEKQKS